MQVANERTLRDLEYEKVKDIIKSFASSSLGRKSIERLNPSANLAVIKARLGRVEELRKILEEGDLPMGRINDLQPILNKARESTSIPPEDFLTILETLESARRLKERIYSLDGEYPKLQEIAKGIRIFRELEESIRRTIDQNGEIKDDASPKLRELAKRKRIIEERIRGVLQKILQSPEYSNMIQDTVIARRSSRLVIPIKSSARHELDWVIQDSSGSGQTLYVEPTSVVEKNNEIRELEGEIRDERIRILKELTARLKVEARQIQKTLKALGLLDSIYAASRYAIEMRCYTPQINTEGRFDLLEARHPLLDRESVVPIDLSFGDGDQGVLVTGPNTGGKTVSLKTLGLLTLMAQSGLQVPTSPDSMISIFKQIRSDIGDEQSIEQSLSTFSSHMSNIVEILKEADRNSLVLLDELGAGTDPQEGAALGVGILRFLLRSGAKLAVTTHFSALKRFAYKHPSLKTCSVDFDVETLSPTYRILEGVGASNALIVAGRLGLAKEVIQEAKGVLPEEEIKAEEIIQDLQRERKSLQKERGELRGRLQEAEHVRREYEEKVAKLREEKEKALSEELKELERFLKSTKHSLEGSLHKAREKELRQELKSILQVEEGLKKAKEQLDRQQRKAVIDLEGLVEGDRVMLSGIERLGTVREIIDAGRIEVEVEGLRVWAKLSDLRWPGEDEEGLKKARTPSYSLSPSSERVRSELHVRGLTVIEALSKVDRYLDRLMLSDIQRGYIIHGKGEGILRSEIRKHLKGLSYVKSFYSAPPREGGDGVTVVELDIGS